MGYIYGIVLTAVFFAAPAVEIFIVERYALRHSPRCRTMSRYQRWGEAANLLVHRRLWTAVALGVAVAVAWVTKLVGVSPVGLLCLVVALPVGEGIGVYRAVAAERTYWRRPQTQLRRRRPAQTAPFVPGAPAITNPADTSKGPGRARRRGHPRR